MDSDSNSSNIIPDDFDDSNPGSDARSPNIPLRLTENICSARGIGEASAAASSNYRQMQMYGQPQELRNGSVVMPYIGYDTEGGGLSIIHRRREAREPYRSRRMLNAENGHYEEGPNEDLFESGPSMARFTGDQEGNADCDFVFEKMQSFMEWFSLGIDITHDVDEQKPAQIARFVIYQRWSKEFCRVAPGLRIDYLRKISIIMGQLENFKDLWGTVRTGGGGNQYLTFEDYYLGGGPMGIEKRQDYTPGLGKSMEVLKDELTNSLTLIMTRNGRSFVSLLEGNDMNSPDLNCTLRAKLEAASDELKMGTMGVATPIIDTDIATRLFTEGSTVVAPVDVEYMGSVTSTVIVDAFKNTMWSPEKKSSSSDSMEFASNTRASQGDSAALKVMAAGGEVREELTRNNKLMHGQRGRPWSCTSTLSSTQGNEVCSRVHALNITWDKSALVNVNNSEIKQALNTAIAGAEQELKNIKIKPLLDQLESAKNGPRSTKLVQKMEKVALVDEQLKSFGKPPSGKKKKKISEKFKKEAKATIQSAQQARLGQPTFASNLNVADDKIRENFRIAVDGLLSNTILSVPKDTFLTRLPSPNTFNGWSWRAAAASDEQVKGPFADITDSDSYFLVKVKRDDDGFYVDLKGQKYYLCGRFPDQFINLLLVTWNPTGDIYLPLATVLILDEAIREILAQNIVEILLKDKGGYLFLQ
ncbi:MAG: hypothetical protein ACXADW_09345, partial [Candidatus Hodarchaeales archaeon]